MLLYIFRSHELEFIVCNYLSVFSNRSELQRLFWFMLMTICEVFMMLEL